MTNKRVLVVDDDMTISTMIQATLEDEGYAVEAAIGGRAIELARREPPDLILLDLVMPIMDGRSVRHHLLNDPRTACVPLVLMSSEERVQQVADELRADACLPKPFEIDDLLDLVRKQTSAA